jgi:hypothetical protein
MPIVLGKYDVQRRLAVGGMGEVFLAAQLGLPGGPRAVIVKTMLPQLAAEPGLVEQFLDEARVVATLNHPNVVSLLDVGVWEGTPVIVMELVRGRTLSQLRRLAHERHVGLDSNALAVVIRDGARGLFHAHTAVDAQGHALGIVHRDVSPQNLMVRHDGVTKVLDFGIARAANRAMRTSTGVVKGKLAYMAPEQVRGEGVTHLADQFALGVVWWELLAGRPLFSADSDLALVQSVLNSPIDTPSAVSGRAPSAFEPIVMRMLERAPNARFGGCNDIAAAIEAALPAGTGTDAVARMMEQLGAEDLNELNLATPADSGPALMLARAPAPTETATVEERKTRPKPQRRWLTYAVAAVPLLAALAVGGWSLKRRDAQRDAEARLHATFEENAWLAEKTIDRFCQESDAVRTVWPRPPVERRHDAAGFLEHFVRWEDGRGVVQLGAIPVPPRSQSELDADDAGIPWWKQISAADAARIDVTWLATLREFDYWSVASGGPPGDPERLINDQPFPDLTRLSRGARLNLVVALDRGDVREALADADHLQQLLRSTDTVIGEMMAVYLAKSEWDAVQLAKERGLPVEQAQTLSLEQRATVKRLTLSAVGFFAPGVAERTMQRASVCALSPCSAYAEAAVQHALAGKYAPAATTEAFTRIAKATPGCDHALLDRILSAPPADPARLSELNGRWTRRMLDP